MQKGRPVGRPFAFNACALISNQWLVLGCAVRQQALESQAPQDLWPEPLGLLERQQLARVRSRRRLQPPALQLLQLACCRRPAPTDRQQRHRSELFSHRSFGLSSRPMKPLQCKAGSIWGPGAPPESLGTISYRKAILASK